jgi:hypothetical protein
MDETMIDYWLMYVWQLVLHLSDQLHALRSQALAEQSSITLTVGYGLIIQVL